VDALSSGELLALRNLAEKRAGNVTPFLKIADAQHLTELGLASRSRQGWDITAAGSAYLTRFDTTEIGRHPIA
jgi:hypothetical protein